MKTLKLDASNSRIADQAIRSRHRAAIAASNGGTIKTEAFQGEPLWVLSKRAREARKAAGLPITKKKEK